MRKLFIAVFLGCWLCAPIYANEGGGEGGGEGAEEASPYVALEPIIVNLDGKRRYLKADVQLQVEGPEKQAKLKAHMPVIRHTLIMLLSNRDPQKILEIEERNKLREEVRDALVEALEPLGVEDVIDDVLFTDFMVQ